MKESTPFVHEETFEGVPKLPSRTSIIPQNDLKQATTNLFDSTNVFFLDFYKNQILPVLSIFPYHKNKALKYILSPFKFRILYGTHFTKQNIFYYTAYPT